MNKEDYEKVMHENITKRYKKTNESKIKTINKSAKKIANRLDLEGRIEKLQENESYIIIKDHKDDFYHNISCRLINPSKSGIGKINKIIIDKINTKLLEVYKVNQWKNTQSVIDWYINIRGKRNSSFVVFDIENFYPSITLELLNNAIKFASEKCTISENDLSIIMQSRQTLLFYDKQPWVKKTGTENFDVPMGCYDGAEVCELVGCYILNQLSTVMRNELVGLYRDDGLGIMKKMSGPEIERKRKQIIKIFKDCGLNITIKTNLTSVDFLDIRLNLRDNTYQPYRKPNSEPIYINKSSNHPKNIIKDLPKAIGKRLSDTSCNQEVFEAALPIYEEARKKSGFNEKLSYTKNNSNNPPKKEEKRRRKRNIIWSNPPYSANVKTKT